MSVGELSDNSDAMDYTTDTKSGNWLQRAVKKNLTIEGLTDKLLKKTVKRNTWIYVSVG